MKLWPRIAIMAALLAAPTQGGELSRPPADVRRYVVFIHSAESSTAKIDLLREALAERGYLVRPLDIRSNPLRPNPLQPNLQKYGYVEYFYGEDEAGAYDVANVINKLLYNGAENVEPELQSAESKRGTIGVWLSGAGTQ